MDEIAGNATCCGRRATLRVMICASATLEVELGPAVIGDVANLSSGGVYIKTQESFEAGTKVLITVTPNEGSRQDPIPVPGVIVRCDEDGVAIQFLHQGPEAEAMLEGLVASIVSP